MKKLYVGNISYNTTEEELRAAFEKYQSIQSVKLITDKFSGESRGFGFIELGDDEEAQRAIQEMDGAELGGKNLKVNEARPQTSTGGGGSRSGGRSGYGRSGGGGGGGRHERGGYSGGGGRSGGGRSSRY